MAQYSPQKVRCPHAARGCRWQGFSIQELETHSIICAFEQMKEYIEEKDKQISELKAQIEQFYKILSNLKQEGLYHMNLEGHASTVVTLAIVDKMLFSGSMDGTLKIWDLNTFQPIREASLGPVFTLKVTGNLMFSGHVNVIKVWDLQTFACRSTLQGHVGNVKALCCVGNRLFSGSSDCSIRIWNLDNFQCLHILTSAHEGEIRDMIPVMDSYNNMSSLWSCSDDGTIKVWDKTFTCEKILKGHKGSIKALTKSGDFVFSGSEDTYIKVWTKDGVEVATISALMGVTALAMSYAGSTNLVSGHTDGVIKIWNLNNMKNIECQMLLTSHTDSVRTLLVSGNTLVSGGYDKTIKLDMVSTTPKTAIQI